MNMQEMYDNFDIVERQEFANNNADIIRDTIIGEDYVDLSGYSKEELLNVLKGRELVDVLNGALYAGIEENEISTWLEKSLL